MYEPLKGFAPVSLMFEIVSTLTVPEEMPVKNVAEFIEYGRKKPNGLTVGAPGQGSPPHLFGALIGEATGVPVQAVQYRGSTQAMTDLAAQPHRHRVPDLRAGQAVHRPRTRSRRIAVAAEKRWSEFPTCRRSKEAGLVKHMVAMWFGLLAPAGTPAPVIAKLNDAVVKASHDPELVKRMTATGTSIRASAPEEMRAPDWPSESHQTSIRMVKRLGLRAP